MWKQYKILSFGKTILATDCKNNHVFIYMYQIYTQLFQKISIQSIELLSDDIFRWSL